MKTFGTTTTSLALLLASCSMQLVHGYDKASLLELYARDAYDDMSGYDAEALMAREEDDGSFSLHERDGSDAGWLMARDDGDDYPMAFNYLSKRDPLKCSSCGARCIQNSKHQHVCPMCNRGKCMSFPSQSPKPPPGTKGSEYSKSGRKRVTA